MHNSQTLKILAFQISSALPPDLGNEVVLTGSVARDCADQFSDVELDIYHAQIPSEVSRINWIRTIQGQQIHSRTELEADGAHVIEFELNGTPCELTWQSYQNFENILTKKNNLHVDHDIHVLCWSCYFMEVLKSKDVIQNLIQEMIIYPSELSDQIIYSTTNSWYASTTARVSCIYRGESLYSLQTLQKDLHKTIQLLYALNQRYHAYSKWLHHDFQNLHILPDNFLHNYQDLLRNINNPSESWQSFIQLLESVLNIIPTGNPTYAAPITRIKNQLVLFQKQLQSLQVRSVF
jgi:hypothetical protein